MIVDVPTEEAEKLWNEAIDLGIKPSIQLYTAMISFYTKKKVDFPILEKRVQEVLLNGS